MEASSPNVAEAASRTVAEVDVLREALTEKVIQRPRDTTKDALSSILSAWSLTSPPETLYMKSMEDVYGYAKANGLSFARRTLPLRQVLLINLPFLAQVSRGSGERWVAVLSVEAGGVMIATGPEKTETLELKEFGRIYSREAVYIWSDPNPDAQPLRARSGGSAVWELQEDLRNLGLLDREPTGVYDAGTIDVISKIQRTTGLLVDGIVGPQTRMVLGNWLETLPVEALAEPAFSDEARARVLSSAGMVLASQAAPATSALARTGAADVESPARLSEEGGPEASTPAPDSDVDLRGVQDDFSREEPPVDSGGKGSESPDPGEADLQAPLEEIVIEGGGTVSIEQLEDPGYRPQLELDAAPPEGSVTQSAGPIVPIVPSDLGLGER